MKDEFVIFDIETTGFYPDKDQIIEIAAMKIDDQGNELGKFDRFVELYRVEKLPEKIVELTNITDEMLENEGQDIVSVMDEFLDFCEDAILVAQNAKFDMSFLIYYCIMERNETYSPLVLDTIDLAKFLKPDESSYSLSNLVKYFAVEYDADKHHRADYDVELTKNVFLKQIAALDWKQEVENETIFIPLTEKQDSFLNSLLGEKSMYKRQKDVFSKKMASIHIDYLLKK